MNWRRRGGKSSSQYLIFIKFHIGLDWVKLHPNYGCQGVKIGAVKPEKNLNLNLAYHMSNALFSGWYGLFKSLTQSIGLFKSLFCVKLKFLKSTFSLLFKETSIFTKQIMPSYTLNKTSHRVRLTYSYP
jgi:hypothetical protein